MNAKTPTNTSNRKEGVVVVSSMSSSSSITVVAPSAMASSSVAAPLSPVVRPSGFYVDNTAGPAVRRLVHHDNRPSSIVVVKPPFRDGSTGGSATAAFSDSFRKMSVNVATASAAVAATGATPRVQLSTTAGGTTLVVSPQTAASSSVSSGGGSFSSSSLPSGMHMNICSASSSPTITVVSSGSSVTIDSPCSLGNVILRGNQLVMIPSQLSKVGVAGSGTATSSASGADLRTANRFGTARVLTFDPSSIKTVVAAGAAGTKATVVAAAPSPGPTSIVAAGGHHPVDTSSTSQAAPVAPPIVVTPLHRLSSSPVQRIQLSIDPQHRTGATSSVSVAATDTLGRNRTAATLSGLQQSPAGTAIRKKNLMIVRTKAANAADLSPGAAQFVKTDVKVLTTPKNHTFRFLIPSQVHQQPKTEPVASTVSENMENSIGPACFASYSGSAFVPEAKPLTVADFAIKKEVLDTVTCQADANSNLYGSQPPKKRQLVFQGSKKPCNCTKSQCLKLYCDCFANGEFCRNCHCTNCKGRIDTERLHNKGCNCKKSSCLKNYCECYEARVPCTARCKCTGCRNTEADRSNRGRAYSGMPQWRSTSPSDLSVCSQICEYPVKPDSPLSTDTQESAEMKNPWDYMSDDAVDATALCLIAQVQELSKKSSCDFLKVQSAVLEEFGRCLQQIVQSVS